MTEKEITYTTNQGGSWKQVKLPEPFREVQIADNGELLGLTDERKMLQKTSSEWKKIAMPASEDQVYDMKIVQNQLFITTRSGMWARKLRDKDWIKIHADETIMGLYKKDNKLFGITSRGVSLYFIVLRIRLIVLQGCGCVTIRFHCVANRLHCNAAK